jgi:glyoxylase-like metal-dependent hydrolase (beta-lactamase superfamily II)
MRLQFAALLSALVLCSSAHADNPETLSERSQAQARAVIDRAAEALGGVEAVNGINAIRLTLEGETYTRLQMPTPKPPFEGGTQHEVLLLDVRNNRLRIDLRTKGAGFEGRNSIVIRNGEGVNYDHRAGTATPIPAAQASQQAFVQYHRRIPNLILRQALARASSLRFLGEERYEDRLHDVVTFVMADTQQVSLYVDRDTGFVSKYELVTTDPLVGEDVIEVRYGDYTAIGAHKAPRLWALRVAGEHASGFTAKVEFNPALDERSFEVPAAAGYARVEPPPLAPPPVVETLAEAVYVLHHFAGPNQNTLVVVFEDHVLAVEAPGASAGADATLAKIKELAPGKPLRFLAMTHHHGDHIGGLRSFIAEGAEIVTTPGNVELVRTMAGAPQNDRLARAPRQPRIGVIEKGRRVFDDGSQRVELIDIGPNPHAKEMVIAWLPKQKIVFQGDLFFMPYAAAPIAPPQASTIAFARALEARKLEAEQIASVHGRTAKRSELDASMKKLPKAS